MQPEAPSPEQKPDPDTYITITDKALKELFHDVKSADFTQAQFEAEKTKRIVALCDLVKSCSDCYQVQLYDLLVKTIQSEYEGFKRPW